MTSIYRNRALADAAVEKLKAYAQPQRLMVLSCLLEGEHTVSEIDAATQIGQPALSQQLAELRRAELVRTRKQAKLVYYSLADEKAALCIRAMEAIFAGQVDSAESLANVLAGTPATANAATQPAGAAVFARIG